KYGIIPAVLVKKKKVFTIVDVANQKVPCSSCGDFPHRRPFTMTYRVGENVNVELNLLVELSADERTPAIVRRAVTSVLVSPKPLDAWIMVELIDRESFVLCPHCIDLAHGESGYERSCPSDCKCPGPHKRIEYTPSILKNFPEYTSSI